MNQWTAKMREALGRLNTELYAPLHEIGFEVRSRSVAPLPPLIDAPRRSPDGRSTPYLVPSKRATEPATKVPAAPSTTAKPGGPG
jgi:hypothetical protein